MSNDFDPASARSKLQLALAKIGRTNGHAPPSGGSNVDPLMHHLLVDSDAHSYFDKRRKESLAAIEGAVGFDKVVAAVAQAKKSLLGSSLVVYEGEFYNLSCQVRKPSVQLDKTKLRSTLIRKHGMTETEVDDLIDKSSEMKTPARVFTVQSR